MHKFLRAIGFSNIRKKDLEIILDEIVEHPEMMKITKDSEGNSQNYQDHLLLILVLRSAVIIRMTIRLKWNIITLTY